jgi:Lar family restriction alleviation protein
MENEELKSCPFCGYDKVSLQLNDRSPNPYPYSAHVLCLNCLASVGTHGFATTKDEAETMAVRAWNKRYLNT